MVDVAQRVVAVVVVVPQLVPVRFVILHRHMAMAVVVPVVDPLDIDAIVVVVVAVVVRQLLWLVLLRPRHGQ